MTVTRLTIVQNLSHSSKTLGAYRIHLAGADEGVAAGGQLERHRPTRNNEAIHSGVFASREAALAAAETFIALPFSVHEELSSDHYLLKARDARALRGEFDATAVLYRTAP